MTHRLPSAHGARLLRTVGAVLFAALLLLPAYAQTTTVNVNVTVTDQNGAVVPGAQVTLTNQQTKQSLPSVTTDGSGVASFGLVPPGRYTATVTVPGFATARSSDITVGVGQANAVFIKLTPELETVNVFEEKEAARPSVPEPEEPRQELSSLPNLNNDLTPVLQIVPGAVATGPSSLGRVIVDGKGNDQQTVRLDGVDFTSQVDFPSADAGVNPISSFQKPEVAGDLDNTSTRSGAFGYQPRYGPGSGLVSEVPTFAGPFSDWQGQVYGEHRNDALNARNFFDYDGKNAIRRTRFGGKFGLGFGEKQRTGLFFAYDGSRGRTESNVYQAVPADAATAGAGGAFAPLMRGFLPPGTEVMPGSRNPDFVVARRRTRTSVESNAWDARMDYRPYFPGDKATIEEKTAPKARRVVTFRLTHQTAENHVPDGVTGRSQRQRFNFVNGLVSFNLIRDTRPIPVQFEKDKKKLSDFGHLFKFGFNLTHARMNAETLPSTGLGLSQSLVTTAGTVEVVGLPLAPLPSGVKVTIPVATLGGLISGSGYGLDLRPVSYTAGYDYSRVLRDDDHFHRWSHELYAGIEARFIRLDYDRLGGMTYSFPNVAALRSGTPGSVTFLSDLSGQSPFSNGAGRRHARQQFYMGYLQMISKNGWSDKPGVGAPSLTLIYGLRYDYFSRVSERANRAVVVDPLTGQILPAGSPFYRVDKVNFQPRFGLAWRLGEGVNTRNTFLRAGVGLYSGVPRIGDLTLPIDSDRFSTGISGGTFPSTPADVLRDFIGNPLTQQFQPLAFARDFSPMERSLKWDVKLSQLRNGYEFSAYYIGNIGRNLALANFANRIVGVTTNPDPAKAAIVVRQFDIVRDGLVFKPFGEFFYRRGGGRSSFNALTLQLARAGGSDPENPRDNGTDPTNPGDQKWTTFKKWLRYPFANFNAKYTLSRSVGNVSGTLMSNPLDPNADFGDNAGVPRHSFSLSAAYELWQIRKDKIRPGAPWVGWKIMPLLKMSKGLPLNIRVARPDVVYRDSTGNVFDSPAAGRTAVLNTPGGGSSGGAFVPNVLPGVNPFANNGTELLNPAAFAIPSPGQPGNLRRGQFRGPTVIQFDLGLRRNIFSLRQEEKENVRGEFQIDILNVFNRANFLNPTAMLSGSLGTDAAQNQLQPGAAFTRAAAGTFGLINAADQSRLIQFTFTLKFKGGFTK